MPLRLSAKTVTITLGPGHVAQAQVVARRSRGMLRFAAPGLPKPLAFALKAKGSRLAGTAVQGAALQL